MKKKRRKSIRLEDLPFYTSIGILCGTVAFIIMVVMLLMSAASKGNLGIFSGVVGIFVFGISTFGLCMNVKGFNLQENLFFTYPFIGISLNGVIMLVSLILYFIGLM